MDDKIVEFVSLLRHNGLRTSISENLDAFRGVAQVGLGDRQCLKDTLRATMVKRIVDVQMFDELFDLYFSGLGEAMKAASRAAADSMELDPAEFKHLIVPILEGRADVAYGSRFLDGGRKGSITFYAANRGLAVLTNVLYGSKLTDIETCYKVFRREVLEGIELRSDRFGIEPELTAKVARRGARIYEVPISYRGRTYAEGKKIGWKDGFAAIWAILRYNLFR